ncbi:MAG: GNAT family N-acetyltransferase [candidate division KSB1 bacterium]|nr:GNAT family N-acetyltransferase [candidate division KSB1 bacterium]
MSLKVLLYEENKANQWDAFVWGSNNGTLFHTQKFLSYHPPGKFENRSLIFTKEERILALFPATVKMYGELKILSSHRGASYGGFVVNSPLSIKDAFRLVDALLGYAIAEGFDGIEMTLPPQIYLRRPSNYLDFALIKRGFTYRKREISSVIPLDFGIEEILNTFSPESRRAVRRAIKLGVKIKESEEYQTFYQILKKNLKLRHNVTPTHTLEELLRLKQLFPDRIRLFSAYVGDTMIAGVVIFDCNPRVALAFYISHNEEFQRYRGVNYLFYEIIRWAIEHGFQFLDFGIFTVDMDPNWGLGRFKEGFGAQGIFRDTLQKFWK